eukprot:SAG22_NODE_13159_length_416_cov_1.624606_1_plen_108_part_10
MRCLTHLSHCEVPSAPVPPALQPSWMKTPVMTEVATTRQNVETKVTRQPASSRRRQRPPISCCRLCGVLAAEQWQDGGMGQTSQAGISETESRIASAQGPCARPRVAG